MTAAVIALAVSTSTAVIGLLMCARWAKAAAGKLSGVADARDRARQERDTVAAEKQLAEAEAQSLARQLSKERTAHRAQLEAARTELDHARDLLRRHGGGDPAVTDERLLRVAERLAPRTHPS